MSTSGTSEKGILIPIRMQTGIEQTAARYQPTITCAHFPEHFLEYLKALLESSETFARLVRASRVQCIALSMKV